MYIPVGRRVDTTEIEKGIRDIKYNNIKHFEKIEKSIKENSKTITIPFSEYEELTKKVASLENQLRIANSECENLLNKYLKFAEDNGVSIEIEEGKQFDKDYNEIKIENIRIPEFRIMRIKR